jgi:hypothetical protein
MQKLEIIFVTMIDLDKKMGRDTIIIAKGRGLQIQLQKMKKSTKKYHQKMVLLEEIYLMKRLQKDVF